MAPNVPMGWLHTMIVWPHGHHLLDAMLDTIRADRNLTILSVHQLVWYEPTTSLSHKGDVERLIECVYANDMLRVERHIRSKTAYLLKLPHHANHMAVTTVLDRAPSPQWTGAGQFRCEKNMHIDALKWLLRRRHNQRDRRGVMLHEHVLHMTYHHSEFTATARCLGVPEAEAYLAAHPIIHVHPQRVAKLARPYTLRMVSVSALRVPTMLGGSAAACQERNVYAVARNSSHRGIYYMPTETTGNCTSQPLTASAPYRFALGGDVGPLRKSYAEAFAQSDQVLGDDLAPFSFAAHRSDFDASSYPKCVVGPDGVARRELVVADESADGGSWLVVEGEHIAALLAATRVDQDAPTVLIASRSVLNASVRNTTVRGGAPDGLSLHACDAPGDAASRQMPDIARVAGHQQTSASADRAHQLVIRSSARSSADRGHQQTKRLN